jgi:ABC transporter substrate binding protein
MASYIGRRKFLAALGSGAAAWPLAARAQQRDRVKRLGVLWGLAENDNVYEPHLSAFQQRLKDLGWIDGRNIRVEYRFTGGVTERIGIAAQELAALAPDVIFATTNPAVAALLHETKTIPIVFALVSDSIGSGFVPKLGTSGRKHYWLPQFRTGVEWEMVGDSQRGRARSEAGSISPSSANRCAHRFHACDRSCFQFGRNHFNSSCCTQRQ